MMTRSVLEIVSFEFVRLLKPLKEKLSDPSIFVQFMAELGWEWEGNIPDFGTVVNDVDKLTSTLTLIDLNKPFSEQLDEYGDLFDSIKALVSSINNISSKFGALPGTIPSDSSFAIKIGKQIFDYLVCTYLMRYHSTIYSNLKFVGVIETGNVLFSDCLPYYTKYIIYWENLSEAISNFFQRMRNKYRWGHDNDGFDGQFFLDHLEEIILSCGIPSGQYNLDPAFAESLYYGKDQDSDPDPDLWVLNKVIKIPLYEIADPNTGYLETGFYLSAVPHKGDVDKKLRGFAIAPFVEGDIGLDFDLADNLNLSLKGDIKTGIAITILPNKVDIEPDMYGTGLGFDGSFAIELSHSSPEGKIVILGKPGESRFEYHQLSASLKLITVQNGYDLVFETAISAASIVIQSSDGDGFIHKILPKKPITLDFDFLVGLSRSQGIHFKGGAGLNYTSHINKSFGPIYINTVDLNLDAGDKGITLITAASGGAKIGPVTASVEKIGLETLLDFTKPGLLGNADFSLDFKPPSAIGLVIDAAGVKGGGFLEMEGGNYTGVLELSIKNKVSLTVIGILTTKMPDGSKTFSLKLFGFAEFAPVQLGLGFVISGIGLAAAIECRMNEEALRDAVYNGSLRSILFPPDPIQNARQIINDLEAFFPARNNCYVFGAMVKLGWGGAKPLVKAEVGIFLETGEVIRIALAGMAYAKLPNEDSPLLILQLQVLGILDFTNKTLAIDSSLKGSKLLNWTLDGDIALRSGWGDNPCFALSCGGFYPGYRAPAGFPSLRRLSITLGSGNPRIGLFLYLATTENSVQCGAMLLFYFSKKIKIIGLIELEGGLAFDALFRFNPFYFETRLAAWLDLKRNGKSIMGIDISLNLTGPNNYRAWGYGKVKIIGIGVEVEFDKTFGTKKPELPQETISPLEILTKELAEAKNWSITMPLWGGEGVLFREGSDTDNYIDPYGGICFRQNSVPLRFKLQKYGRAAIPAGEDYFDIVAQNGSEAPDAEDFFAPGEFKNLSDQQKISAPAFEKMKSGIQFSSNHIQTDYIRHKAMEYETKYMDESKEFKPVEGVAGNLIPPALLGAQELFGGKIKAKTGVASAGIKGVSVNEQKFTIVTPEARGNKFERAGIGKNGVTTAAGNLTFAKTMQEKEKMGIKDTEVVDSMKAVAVESF